LILLLAGSIRLADASDLKDTISNLYGGQGILLEPLPVPFPSQESRFQASSLQGLDQLNSQLTSAIGVPSFNSSVGGYLFDIERGVPVQTTESLGPLLTERATTIGARKLDLTFSYTRVNSQAPRKDQTILSSSSMQRCERGCDPGSPLLLAVATSSRPTCCRLTEDIFALIATYGLTADWDVGFVVPVTHIRFTATSQAAIFDQFGNPGGTKVGDIPIHQFGPTESARRQRRRR
jgi:hypothetical protein